MTASTNVGSTRGVGLRVVSLFSGAGGLEIAACRAGPVAAMLSTDSHEAFLATISANLASHFPSVEHCHRLCDVRQLQGEDIRAAIGGVPDIVMGGPPCDDFTDMGARRGFSGSRGPLVFEFARLVDELRPRAFLFENVPLLARKFRSGFDDLLRAFATAGYSLDTAVLPAWAFGAPTVRERVFVVGVRSDSDQSRWSGFPSPTHSRSALDGGAFDAVLPTTPTVGEVLGGLPDVTDPSAEGFANHRARSHRPETIAQLKELRPGAAVSKSFRYRPRMDGLCRSLTAGRDDSTKAYIHPIFHREMTVREYARIHGFPDTWTFAGTMNNGIKQVANAVPVPLGEAVLKRLFAALWSE
jgi:DNA (cytosine-5)-methyltransferase 1